MKHRQAEANGISMHVAETGSAEASTPVILSVHCFLEQWYSWRHQMLALATRSYRCVVPDLRGYGGTTAPLHPSSYSVFHIVGDLIALHDALHLLQVCLVGRDWGAIVSWNLCLLRSDRVRALVNLRGAFMQRRPGVKPVEYFCTLYDDDYYVCWFQQSKQRGTWMRFLSCDPNSTWVEYHKNM